MLLPSLASPSPTAGAVAADPARGTELALATRSMHAFLLLHLLLWTLVPALTQTAPPWDNIEQLVWSQSLQWGYYKHPPAPTWWVAAWVALFGHHVWVTYLAAQACVAAALWLMWRIALQLTTPARAFAATALTALVAYHGMRGGMANHNTLQLLPVALFLSALLAGVRTGRWWWWAAAGAAGAWCLLSKYSALVWFAAAFAWLLRDARMDRARWTHAVLACVLGSVLVAPHVLWLFDAAGAPLDYARVALDPHGDWWRVVAGMGHYLGSQLLRLLGLAAGLGLLAWLLRREPRVAATPARDRNFLLLLGVGPLVLSVLLGAAGVPLHASWASTFFLFAGLFALRAVPAVAPSVLVRAAFAAAVAVNVGMAAVDAAVSGWLVKAAGRNARANFPARELSAELQRAWRRETGLPLRVVSGETWMAGNVAAHWPGRPRVLVDGETAKAPWVDGRSLAECGYIALYQHSANPLDQPQAVQEQSQHAPVQGVVRVPWGREPLVVEYGMVPPGPGCTASR